MEKNKLIKSAESLTAPQPEMIAEFSRQKGTLVEKVVNELNQRQDLDKLIGENNKSMMVDNAANMARFMESMFQQYNPTVFVETILWVFSTYRNHGFNLSFWPAHLNVWITLLQSELDAEISAALVPFYSWIQVNIPVFTLLTNPSD